MKPSRAEVRAVNQWYLSLIPKFIGFMAGYFYLFTTYGQQAADFYTSGVLLAIIIWYCPDWIRQKIQNLVVQAHDENPD